MKKLASAFLRPELRRMINNNIFNVIFPLVILIGVGHKTISNNLNRSHINSRDEISQRQINKFGKKFIESCSGSKWYKDSFKKLSVSFYMDATHKFYYIGNITFRNNIKNLDCIINALKSDPFTMRILKYKYESRKIEYDSGYVSPVVSILFLKVKRF